ncbi:MAG: UMP kinase, partial [Thermotogota bacterium]|nr:UMP kinase [Thermotogota bacterium]
MYKRVLLKLSGEVLSGEGGRGFDEASVNYLLEEILPVIRTGTQLAIVIGAGNLVRGRELRNLRNSRADELGMLGTVMNAVYLKEILSEAGV